MTITSRRAARGTARTAGRERAHSAEFARYYDLDLLNDPGDLAFYRGLLGTDPRRILELGVGSGRIAVPLAASGHDVTGVDNDDAMLARARAAWQASTVLAGRGRLTLIAHDLTTLSLPVRFDLVFVALNSFLMLDGRAAQARAMQVMREHLAPHGRAVIDIWCPAPADLALYDGRQVLEWIRTDPETGDRIAKTTVAHYEPATHTATLTTFFDVQSTRDRATGTARLTRVDTISFITPDELLEMAGAAGLAPQGLVGEYDMTPWSESTERVVMIARAAAA